MKHVIVFEERQEPKLEGLVGIPTCALSISGDA